MEEQAVRAEARGETKRGRVIATVAALDRLIGAHPDALADLYRAGTPSDPSRLGTTRARLLGIDRFSGAHVAMRPLLVAVAKHLSPLRGKVFESGGTAGTNIVLGRRLFRFYGEVASSALDGRPSLVLRYDGLGNPWPITRVVDELRTVSAGVSIGPALWPTRNGAIEILFWWGIEAAD